jgi:hypothetical protein
MPRPGLLHLPPGARRLAIADTRPPARHARTSGGYSPAAAQTLYGISWAFE